MARISVTPERLVAQAAQLSYVPGQLTGDGAALAGAAGAAADTLAAEPLDSAIGAWTAVVQAFAVATADTSIGLSTAAAAYVLSDRLPGRG